MKTAFAIIVLVALAGLSALSFAPAEMVGERSGLRSFAGLASALGLLALMLVGGWVWARDRRTKHD